MLRGGFDVDNKNVGITVSFESRNTGKFMFDCYPFVRFLIIPLKISPWKGYTAYQ